MCADTCGSIADKADPVGLKIGTEGMGGFLVDVFDQEGFVIDPVAIAGEVDLSGNFAWGSGGDREGLFIVASHEVGIGGSSGFHFGVRPRSSFSDWFTKAPKVIDGSGPEGGFTILRMNEVRVVFGSVFGNTRKNKKPTVAAVILNTKVVGGDRANSGEAEGIVGREFVKGSVGVEKITLGCDFTTDAAGPLVEIRVALWEAEAFTAVVDVEDGGRVDLENPFSFWNGGIFLKPGFGVAALLPGDFDESQVGIELVESLVGGEVEVAPVITASSDDSAGGVFVRSGGETVKDVAVLAGFAGVGVCVGEPSSCMFESSGA